MLTNIHLFQFKRFKDELIEFFPLTLLTGINGMGKSSVIEALLALRQSYDRGELQNNKKLVIEDKLVNLISPDDMLCSVADSFKVGIGLTDHPAGQGEWAVEATGNINTLPVTFKSEAGNVYHSNLFDSFFQYLRAERIGPRAVYNRLSVAVSHSPIGCSGEFVANRLLESVTKNETVELDHLILPNIGKTVYDQLSAWISEILYPGTKVYFDDSDETKIKLEYSFREEQTKRFNPVNIGFGFSFALPVILAVLTAKKGALLIVENPEAHLHPKGQSRMGRFLALAAQSGLQIVIETHSDHLLNGIRVAVKQKELDYHKTQIHFFTHIPQVQGGGKISFAIEEDGGLEKWPPDFFDEWDNMLDRLIE